MLGGVWQMQQGFSSTWILFKGLFHINVIYPLPSFMLKSTLKISGMFLKIEAFAAVTN